MPRCYDLDCQLERSLKFDPSVGDFTATVLHLTKCDPLGFGGNAGCFSYLRLNGVPNTVRNTLRPA